MKKKQAVLWLVMSILICNYNNAAELKNIQLEHGIKLKVFDDWDISKKSDNEKITASAKDKVNKAGIKPNLNVNAYEVIFNAKSETKYTTSFIGVSIGPPELDQEELKSFGELEIDIYKELLKQQFKSVMSVLNGRNMKLKVEKIILNGLITLKISSSFDIEGKPSAYNQSYKFFLSNKTVTLNIEKRSHIGDYNIDGIDHVINSFEIEI
ncbi:MAG: hypothetical protein HWE27_14030 [Gammaproteobacteria bacterium]|nr:hypothetical protein [Gammaproteobacteria bacterium]